MEPVTIVPHLRIPKLWTWSSDTLEMDLSKEQALVKGEEETIGLHPMPLHDTTSVSFSI